ncbi:hypothetical protein [Paenibacillus macquariensis]|uniref:Uncharacterized protein n=1 Tax=Paenibacillus macquariensis TaxID=948756 RepID=A0ABY1JV45_9BACL|nr:hypothetical protein [Paenibacillus macquariensis]MEC0090814.1 hypothetical protein [Paenibacillus macquariensis]OAB34553.1 hypothetical protein PMSM_11870 [Paenibacillus macquariensis subsp. macquariensis]SIQ83059.1 hypothetical protein SAMN05421578_104252 [Paenibacillus macquariensis]
MTDYNQTVVDALPPKGNSREKAISELGVNEAPELLHLASTERGKSKLAAQRTLAKIDYEPATAYWKKLLNSPQRSEKILNQTCSNTVSDLVADRLLAFLQKFLKKEPGSTISWDEHETLIALLGMMPGKASEKMCEVYELAADQIQKVSSYKRDIKLAYRDTSTFHISETLRDMTLEQAFPMILVGSVLMDGDIRLQALASKLYEQYGGDWLSPVFASSLLTKPAGDVFEEFSKYYKDPVTRRFILNVLGTVKFDTRQKRHTFMFGWGYILRNDTYFSLTPLLFEDLDMRWIDLLATDPEEKKLSGLIKTSLYVGRVTGEFDDVLGDLLPLNNEICCQKVQSYFLKRAILDDGIGATYVGILYRIGYEDVESILMKKWSQKENGTTIWNVSSDLLSFTRWPAQKRVALFEQIGQLVQEKKLEIGSWKPDTAEELKNKLLI